MESAIRVDANMKLQIVVYATAAVSVNYASRLKINGDEKVPDEKNIAAARITTDGAANYFYVPLYGSKEQITELLNVVTGLATAGIQRGQCFIRVGITIGGTDGVASTPFRILFSDYVTSNSFLAYPGSSINDSLSGRGYLNNIDISTLTTAVNFTLPSNNIYRPISCIVVGECSAVVGNRKIGISVTSGGANFLLGISSDVFVANEVFNLSFVKSSIANDTLLNAEKTIANLVDVFLGAGSEMTLFVDNIDVGDSISGTYFLVEQWIKA